MERTTSAPRASLRPPGKSCSRRCRKAGDTGFLLGVSDNKLLLDGIPLETGQAERSFAQLLNAAGLSSILFSNKVTLDDFTRLVRAFAMGGSKAQDFAKQIKETLGENKTLPFASTRSSLSPPIPATGEFSMAAQLAAQSLGPEFKQWLNDPQKLLQLIAAAQGASSAAPANRAAHRSAAFPAFPFPAARNRRGTGLAPAAERGAGGVVPLQEEEVIQTIRLLTHFGQAMQDPNASPDNLKAELGKSAGRHQSQSRATARKPGLAGPQNASDASNDTPLLMKAAESMAIKFALDRYQRATSRSTPSTR